mgnify:CR=1 FL=1
MNRNENKRIMVIGDFMLDHYVKGNVLRISPEAPVPVFLKKSEEYVAGGAANVVANLLAANQEVIVLSAIGEDESGSILIELLKNKGCDCDYIIKSKKRKTSKKTRIMAQNNQQIVRIDDEQIQWLDDMEELNLLSNFEGQLRQTSLIILSDYMKGILSKSLCSQIIKEAKKNDIPILIDVKDVDMNKYKGATLLKPNRKELSEMTGMSTNNRKEVRMAARFLLNQTKCDSVLATLGNEGMFLCENEREEWIQCENHEVYDVSGAGDTAISYYAVGLVNGMTSLESAKLANHAAGIKVTKLGTSPVTLEEVQPEKKDDNIIETYEKSKKIITLAELKEKLNEKKGKVVFTNGCFDILHFGHVGYLRKAASFGDILVVGINSDVSVKKIKGDSRPINNENDRAELIAALECVDYVTIFEEVTPLNLIKSVKPDVLVKGSDYNPDEVIGADFVKSYGGELKLIPVLEGRSTSLIIKKVNGEK